MLDVEPRIEYGPSFKLGIHGERAAERTREFDQPVKFISEELAKYNVRELERLSTAFFVETNESHKSKTDVADRVADLKPHIPHNMAIKAVEQVRDLRQSAHKLELAS